MLAGRQRVGGLRPSSVKTCFLSSGWQYIFFPRLYLVVDSIERKITENQQQKPFFVFVVAKIKKKEKKLPVSTHFLSWALHL